MIWAIKLVTAYVATLISSQTCVASVFNFPGDPYQTPELACKTRSKSGIAHRTLPCGSKVLLISPRTGKKVVSTVIDRGPYGSVWRGSYRLKRTATQKGEWRGCLDITDDVKKALNHNGLEPLVYFSFN